MMIAVLTYLCFALNLLPAYAWRHEPTEPFPPPPLTKDDPRLQAAFHALDSKIKEAASSDNPTPQWRTNVTSYSVAVTSASDTLWTTSHTAPILGDYVDSPRSNVTDQTYFRIASISKVFTVLACLIEQQAGKWSLKDPITEWVPELRDAGGGVEWDGIMLESLASQLSGIVREYGQSDLIDPVEGRQYGFSDPVEVGFPPVDAGEVPPCGQNRAGTRPCSRKEILAGLLRRPPLFEPNYRATYSNMNFVLLGFALERLTGLSYEELVDRIIFKPLGMRHSRLTKPRDGEGVIPNGTSDWNAAIGTYGPTGGIFTTASDLATFARAILTHQLLNTSATNAWFNPHSYSDSYAFAYGMPWEIFRTQDLLPDSNRIQTLITKAGGLRGYSSQLILLPEYDIALVLLVAGDGHALTWMRDEVLSTVVPAVEDIARTQTAARLAGTYVSANAQVNSSICVEVQGNAGLVLTSWISNGTDFLARYVGMARIASGLSDNDTPGRVQLTPARLTRGERGEVWRVQFVPDEAAPTSGLIDMRLITDVDTFSYAARSVEEFVFLVDGGEGRAEGVEIPGLRITLVKQQSKGDVRGDWNRQMHDTMKIMGL